MVGAADGVQPSPTSTSRSVGIVNRRGKFLIVNPQVRVSFSMDLGPLNVAYLGELDVLPVRDDITYCRIFRANSGA